MTLERVQRTAAAVGAVGLLLLATPTHAQTTSTSATEPTMTLGQVQVTSPPAATLRAAAEDASIRPFRFTAPQAALDDLRRRIKATQWPERETVSDATQGVQLATMQKLAAYWATDRSEEHTSELQSLAYLVCRLL